MHTPSLVRSALRVLGVLGLIAAASTAWSAPTGYPEHAVTLVVGYPPGGPTDIGARLFAARLGEVLKQSVVVENRAGAGGRIGTDYVARAKPDGYTLVFGNSTTHGLLSSATKPLSYDPIKSFTPIAPLFQYTAALVCNPGIPARTVPELVAYMKQRPNGMSYGSPGIGSGAHFAGERFGAAFGLKVLHVPFKGSAPALQAVAAGDVDCSFDGAARGQIAAGTVRGFATTGINRDPSYNNLPTLNESGIKGFDLVTWQALLGPAGLPGEVREKLQAATKEVLGAPDFEARLLELGFVKVPEPPDALTAMIQAEIAKYRQMARQFGIEFE
jgi:tripartite-type tricarboxylate transporter receptor subunit TctC